MSVESLIDEICKLPPEDRRAVEQFILAGKIPASETTVEQRTLHEVLSQSPFADLEFDPQGVRSIVRPVEL